MTVSGQLSSCVTAPAPPPQPVEIRFLGDDGLSMRLTQAVIKSINATPSLTYSNEGRGGTVVAQTSDHVGWKRIGGRTQANYDVKFRVIGGGDLGRSVGSCWEDEIAKCAAQISADLVKATREIK